MLQKTMNIANLSLPCDEAYLAPLNGREPYTIDGIVSIGRQDDNDIVLFDPHVSGHHCRLEKRPHGYYVRDLKSRNGVLVNGLKVFEGQLLDGAQIQIGSTGFIFQTQISEEDKSRSPLKSKNKIWSLRLRSLVNLSETQLPVFIQGESGTGKEILAGVIHDLSLRSEKPFISVNCSALTETLVESELFGHVKGSFTGATSDRKGSFEAARGGTLFLDEIGDLPPSLQPKLLRALENQEIRPVGSDKVIKTDVRIVSATHKNLEEMVTQGKFRADLYFRIHVIKIPIPALRERIEDFEDILNHFSREYRARFSVPAIEKLKKHFWPGNIRELKNVVARASALFPQTFIQPEHVSNLVDYAPPPKEKGESVLSPRLGSLPFLKDVEKELIRARLIANKGNQRRTALDLGMAKSTLHDRIKSYKIVIPSLADLNGLEKDALDAPVVKDPIQ